MRQDVTASGNARQAVQGTGVQINNYGADATQSESTVSIAPPFGLRNESQPVRGRDALLAELEEAAGQVHVVHGLGGCGKSTLALEVSYRARQHGAGVWWVSAAEPDDLIAGMRAVGRRVGVSDAELSHGDACDVIWQRLSTNKSPWLLVFDNADDPRVLAAPGMSVGDGRGWLRPVDSAVGQVLVTTRDGSSANWGSWCVQHRLPMLAVDDAATVLIDRAGHCGTHGEARALAKRLGGLPLALRIAGSYLAESVAVPGAFAESGLIRTFRQYREALDAGGLDQVFPSPAREGVTQAQARHLVGRTWNLSLDLLDARQLPEARNLLRLLSCFAETPIPYELLHPATMSQSPLFAGINGPRLWQAMRALDSFGLIELGLDPGAQVPVVLLHPLVRDTSSPFRQLPMADKSPWVELVMSLVSRSVKDRGSRQQKNPMMSSGSHLASLHVAHVTRRILDLQIMQVLGVFKAEGWTRPGALPYLASVGGRALTRPIASDNWNRGIEQIGRLFRQDDQKEIEAVFAQLNRSRSALGGLSGDDLSVAWTEQADIWRIRLSNLLQRDPAVADELCDLLADLVGVQRAYR